jgi:hypothetical protein
LKFDILVHTGNLKFEILDHIGNLNAEIGLLPLLMKTQFDILVLQTEIQSLQKSGAVLLVA